MVLGQGMIGHALQAVDQADVLFLASGLSNAKGHIPAEREREQALVAAQVAAHPGLIACYISSYSVDDEIPDNNSPYLQHKRQMEQLVKSHAGRYLIVRTSNVVGSSRQPGNLMNFIYRHLRNKESFDIWTATTRNLIDVRDLARMLDYYLHHHRYSLNKTIYLINPDDLPILEIERHFEAKLGIQGHYQLVNKGAHYDCDKQLATELFAVLGIDRKDYVPRLIDQYFSDSRG